MFGFLPTQLNCLLDDAGCCRWPIHTQVVVVVVEVEVVVVVVVVLEVEVQV